MSASEIAKVTCGFCGFERVRVKEGKNGTLSGTCSECGTISMVKSPAGVAKVRAKLGAAAPPKASNQDDFAKFINGGQ